MKKNYIVEDLFEVASGSTPSTSVESYWSANVGGIKWITPKDLSHLESSSIFNTERKITQEGLDSCSARLIPKGSIILSSRAPIGYVAVLEDAMACNQGCKALIPKKPKEVDPFYFYYLFLTKEKALNNLGSGSTFKELSKTKLEKFPIEVHDIKKQNEIAQVLEQANKARQQRKVANALTDQFLQSSFLSLFGDPVTNEKGWEVKKLEDVADVNPRMNGERELPDNYRVSFIPMAAVDEIDGRITKFDERSISQVRKGFTYFKEDDVLFAKITPCMENGKAAIAKGLKNGLGFGTTEFHVIRCGKEIIPDYIYSIIRFQHFRDLAEDNMTGSAGQKRVPSEFLKKFNTPIPPLTFQHKFAGIATQVEQLRQKQRESEHELEALFQSLLQKYFG